MVPYVAVRESRCGPGGVKIAWEARNWECDGAFYADRDSDSTDLQNQPQNAQTRPEASCRR